MNGESRQRDRWAEWLLERRHGGDPAALERQLSGVHRFRDRVLENAAISEGDVVLDVGTGTGLIGFGALDLVGETGRVIFSDVSEQLLDECRRIAEDLGVLARCDLVLASADDLHAIDDESVDVVTTRSVLIYLPDKRPSFREFFRVLTANGRVSVFEPINSFGYPEPDDLYQRFDATPIRALAAKLRAVGVPPSEHPLLNFDERDLLAFAEKAGFHEIELDLNAKIEREVALGWGWDEDGFDWEAFLNISGNPHAPTLAEVLDDALTPEERDRFVAYLRPLFEGRKATARSSVAYLRAVKR